MEGEYDGRIKLEFSERAKLFLKGPDPRAAFTVVGQVIFDLDGIPTVRINQFIQSEERKP